MHETVFAKQIIEAAEKVEKEQGKIKGITIEVGGLAHVPGHEMKEIMERMKPEWKIKLVEKKAQVKCMCGYEGEPNIVEHSHDHTVFFCPKCNGVPEVIDGKDIVLKSVDIE